MSDIAPGQDEPLQDAVGERARAESRAEERDDVELDDAGAPLDDPDGGGELDTEIERAEGGV